MFNQIAITTAQALIFTAQPKLGLWNDPAALMFSSRLHEISSRLHALQIKSKVLDALAAVPGV